jgi:hypothetical protein
MVRKVAAMPQAVSCIQSHICVNYERGDFVVTGTKRRVRRMTPKEIVLIYLIFALFFSLIGYIYADTTSESVEFDFSGIEAPGIGFIFANNIGFFSLVCVLPFFNFVMYATQFLAIGNNIFQIHALPMEVQSNLLYRHAIFEIVALSVSVYISYEVYRALYDYLHNSIKPSKKTYMKIFLPYIIVVTLTLIGACLEGTVNV